MPSKAGSSNRQPSTSEETEDAIILAKEEVKKVGVFYENTINLLEKTYRQQRLYLNNKSPTILQVKNEWPVLTRKAGILWHYTKLMNQDISILHGRMLHKAGSQTKTN